MEFLVSVEIDLPPEMDPERRRWLLVAESERAAELAEAGTLVRLWRVPGRRANRGLWRAADATELHEALRSLPLFAWMDIQVEALARHENDPGGPHG
jgi:muconolactone D-isomerase